MLVLCSSESVGKPTFSCGEALVRGLHSLSYTKHSSLSAAMGSGGIGKRFYRRDTIGNQSGVQEKGRYLHDGYI